MFSSKCFTEGDSYVTIICVYSVVFNKHDTLHFRDNAHLPKNYPM